MSTTTTTTDDPTAWAAQDDKRMEAGELEAGIPVQPAKPEPARDRWGRYLFPAPTGAKVKAYTRATTVAKTLADTYNLEQWQMRQVASGLAARPDLVQLAATHSPDDDKTTYAEIVEAALESSGSAQGRRRGTALHRLTESHDLGTLDRARIPADMLERLDAYQQEMTDKGFKVDRRYVEMLLILDGYDIGGTTDRFAHRSDGRLVVADVKTAKPDPETGGMSKHGHLEIAIQLAIYANHTATYDPIRKRRGPRVDVDKDIGYVIHLPSQGPPVCNIYEVDLAKGYEALIVAMEAREWRKTKGLLKPYRPVAVGTGGPRAVRDWLAARVTTLKNEHPAAYDALRARWPTTVPRPFPEEPAAYMVEDLATALDIVEKAHEIPFGPTRPGTVATPATTKPKRTTRTARTATTPKEKRSNGNPRRTEPHPPNPSPDPSDDW